MFKCQKNEVQLVWSSSTSKQTLWRIRKILDPAIFVVSGVCGKVNEVSEKRSATSVIIIHIKSDSLKNKKNSRSCDFCSFRCLRKSKWSLIMKIIMFKCQQNEVQLVWSSSTSKQTLWRIRKNSRSWDFCSFRCLRKSKWSLIMTIRMLSNVQEGYRRLILFFLESSHPPTDRPTNKVDCRSSLRSLKKE